MDFINSALTWLFNLLLLPFRNLDPVWGMLVISFATGIIMLFVFKATSDQKGIKRAKNLVKGHFLAIRLYKDDISLMFNTISNILASNLLYMKKSLRPMLFLIVPIGLVLIQLGIRYEYRPLKTGEAAIISLRVDETASLTDVKLKLPQGIRLDMPPVRAEREHEVSWRIVAEQPGEFVLGFQLDGAEVSKRLVVEDSLVPLSAAIAGKDLGVTIMNPAESSLSGASFASLISITYPKREFNAFGFHMHWLVAFFVFSLIAAFGCKGFLGVEV